MPDPHFNAIVVGAGAGGGVVAKELSEAGLSVLLLERGGWPQFEELGHDELSAQAMGPLRNAYGPDDERHRRVIKTGDGSWRSVMPTEGGFGVIAANVGSGTATYGAMAWRFMPQDFRMRTTYGCPEGSTLDDWPISYDDLEPCYERAEWEIGVSGDDSANPFAPPRRKPRPMPPHPYARPALRLESAANRLGMHPFPIPMLRNTVPYGGRPACVHCRYCNGYTCEVNAKNGTHNTVIPQALATGNCSLLTGCGVSEVVINDRGRAEGVRYYDADNRLQTRTSDLVVVSASAIETARLLLNSRSRLFPRGAGNRYDWVGRNLQDHAYTGAYGLLEEEIYDDIGPGAQIAICDFNHGNDGLRGGGYLCNQFLCLPYAFTKRRPPGVPRWGKAHKDFQRRYFKRFIGIHGPVQEMPVFTSRVEIEPGVRDYWGIPVAKISGERHAHDIEICQFVSAKAEAWLREAGATRTWPSVPGRTVAGSSHQAGTCRMGDDPKTSVTNRYGQVHEVDNLFLTDASLHVTNGGFNPALTIMALGYWVSGYIAREWKGTRFR
ncbi:MAG: GMC family oxidoreductase [Acidobacteria bacterium]|nr:MAG: GMC family oxidoreductase [Acidobacteriota bacterium]